MTHPPEPTPVPTALLWVAGRELRTTQIRELIESVTSARVEFLPDSAWDDPDRVGELGSMVLVSPGDLKLDAPGRSLLRRWVRKLAVVALEPVQRPDVAVQVFEAGAHDYMGLDKTDSAELAMRLTLAQARFERESELRRQSLTDELTRLLNRRGFLAHGQERLSGAMRSHKPFLVLYVDVDDMKSINDSLGHHAGDRVLATVADALRKTFRVNDAVGRLSGDEFAVLADGATLRDVRRIERRLRSTLSNVGVSIGFAEFDPAAPVSLQELLGRADAAMYAQKRRHRFRLR